MLHAHTTAVRTEPQMCARVVSVWLWLRKKPTAAGRARSQVIIVPRMCARVVLAWAGRLGTQSYCQEKIHPFGVLTSRRPRLLLMRQYNQRLTPITPPGKIWCIVLSLRKLIMWSIRWSGFSVIMIDPIPSTAGVGSAPLDARRLQLAHFHEIGGGGNNLQTSNMPHGS